jgi:hypothetical protein
MNIKDLLERIVQLGLTHPSESVRKLDSYGWDRDGESNRFTHPNFPGHQMHITGEYVRHSHHGIGVNVKHDDFAKYIRGLHTQASGYKDHDWVQDEEED